MKGSFFVKIRKFFYSEILIKLSGVFFIQQLKNRLLNPGIFEKPADPHYSTQQVRQSFT